MKPKPFHLASLMLAILFLILSVGKSRAEMLPDAQVAMKKGVIAAKQQDYLLAIRYFQDARKIAPDAPEIYYNLGLAESKIPGRELRAICWFEAYLAATMNAPNAAAVKDQIDMLEVKSQSNISHLIQSVQDAAIEIPIETEGRTIPYTYKRNGGLSVVAQLWEATGDFSAAKKAIGLMPPTGYDVGVKESAEKNFAKEQMQPRPDFYNEYDKAKVRDFVGAQKSAYLVSIVKAQAKAGDITGALKTADLIPEDKASIEHGEKCEAQVAIAEAQVKAGDIAGAQKTLAAAQQNADSMTKDYHYYHSAERAIAGVQVKAGDIAGAQKTADFIQDPLYKSFVLEDIAHAQAKAGDIAGAQKTAGLVPEKDRIVRAVAAIAQGQAEAGDITGALKTADSIQDELFNGVALSSIAAVQAKAGDIVGGLKTAGSIQYAGCKSDALVAIAKAQAKAGDIVGALKTAGSIQDADRKSDALVAIAEAKMTARDIAGALNTLEAAQKAAVFISVDWVKARVGKEIAEAQAKAGDITSAQKTAYLIPVGNFADYRGDAQKVIAEVQAQAQIKAEVPANAANAPSEISHLATTSIPTTVDPVVSASEWIRMLEGNNSGHGELSDPVYLNFANYLKSIPSDGPGKYFKALSDAAFKMVDWQNDIDRMVKKQAMQRALLQAQP